MTPNRCEICAGRRKRGFEPKPCAAAACPYKHLGYFDSVEWKIASMRYAIYARGIRA
jgi:hypothetical protein